MAGSIVLRSYMDLVNGPLENTVDYSTTGDNAITQKRTAMRRFTQRIGCLAKQPGTTDVKGFYFNLGLTASEVTLEANIVSRLSSGGTIKSNITNSLAYNRNSDLAKYCIDFEEDLPSPRYLAFFNLDSKPVFICKKASLDSNNVLKLVPFLEVPPNRSIGPVVFNAKYGNIFAVVGVDADSTDMQDLYVIAYNE